MINSKKVIFILWFLFTVTILIAIALPHIPRITGDSLHYIKASEHGPYGIIRPHGTRALMPFLVRLMKPIVNIHEGFFIIGTMSLLLFVLLNMTLLNLLKVPPSFASIILLNPLLVTYYTLYYLPDIFFMLLLSIYFILIFYDKQYLAAFLLILLFLTRETIILLSLTVVIISIYNKNRTQLIFTIIGTIVGLLGLTAIKHISGSNIWGVPEVVYLILKVPYTILRNLGIDIYTNVSPFCQPIFTFNLPAKYSIGAVKTIGLCKWNPGGPLETLSWFLALFGVGPIILFYLLYKKIIFGFIRTNWLMIVFYYGIVMYLLGLIISVDRLRVIGYGWPIFWLIIPSWLFLDKKHIDIVKLKQLLLIHLLICWIPYTLFNLNSVLGFNFELLSIYYIVFTITLILYIIGWRMIKKADLFEAYMVYEKDPHHFRHPS